MRLLVLVTALIFAGGAAGASGADRWADLTEQARRLYIEGRLRESEECLTKALKVAETFEPNDVRLPQTLTLLGTAVWNVAKPAEAEQLYLRALRLWEHMEPGGHPEAAVTLSSLATLRRISGRYREAELLNQRALSMTDTLFGAGSPESAMARRDLAAVNNALGRYEKTVLLLNPDAEVWDRVPPSHRAAMLNLLGLAQLGLGRDKEAERQLSSALRIRREVLGPAHPKVAEACANLALVKANLGEFKEAEVLIKESLSIVLANFGPGHPLEAPVRRVSAHLLRETGHKKEARAMDQQALEIEQAWAHAAHGGAYAVDVEELRSTRQK
jgi:tetratricopeptide (TPR) repeat protein